LPEGPIAEPPKLLPTTFCASWLGTPHLQVSIANWPATSTGSIEIAATVSGLANGSIPPEANRGE
jgi:hypothetical protein